MTAIQGLRGTGQFTSDFRPTNYRELFTLLEPNGTAPLQALLAMTGSESTDDPKYNHFRDELPDRTLTTSATVGAAATSVVYTNDDDEAFIVAGTLIYVPETGEVIRVTANNTTTNTLTVTRGVGQAGTGQAITSGAELVIAGHADQEGGTSPDPISFDPTTDFNYTQIFKTSW